MTKVCVVTYSVTRVVVFSSSNLRGLVTESVPVFCKSVSVVFVRVGGGEVFTSSVY